MLNRFITGMNWKPLILSLNCLLLGIYGVEDFSAVLGGQANLPCNISLSSKDEVISMILWYKDESEVPVYTLDVRKATLQKARHFPSIEYGARVYFDVSETIPRLKIDYVTENDEGEYRCRIDFRRSRTVTHTVHLVIRVPPKTVLIKDENGKTLKDTIGPFDEGSYLTLVCEAYGGNPPPVVSWWKGDLFLDDSYSPMTQGIIRNEILLPNLQRSDLFAVLSCQASNTNLTTPKSAKVILDLNLKPFDVHLIPSPHLSAGKKVKIVCNSSGSRPPSIITWWKEKTKLHTAMESIGGNENVTSSILSITPTTEDNGKTITCRSNHPSILHEDLEDSFIMNVFYVPNITLSFGANIQQSSIKEGSDVYFECYIKANPWVTDVSWNFQGRPLFSNTSAGVIVSNQSLVLQRVKREHEGFYQCTGTNIEGEGASNKIALKVQYAPVCKQPAKTVFGVARDETIDITCEVEANPKDMKFRWVLNNTIDSIEIKTHNSNSTSSTITYTPWTMFGYGALLCWGENIIGYQKIPCEVRLIPAGPPDSLKDCHVTNLTTNSLLVKCDPGYDGGMQQIFHLEVYNSAIQHLQMNLTSSDLPVFSIENLPEETSYVLVFYASNKKGRSDSVVLMESTLASAERRTAKEEDNDTVNPILGILIGTIGVLILLALILTLLLKLHCHCSEKGILPQKRKPKCEVSSEKDINELNDRTEKGPDIIPPTTDILCYISSGVSDNLHQPSEVMYSSVLPTTDNFGPLTQKQALNYREYEMEYPQPSTIRKLMPVQNYSELNRPTRKSLHEPLSHVTDEYRKTPEWPVANEPHSKEMKTPETVKLPCGGAKTKKSQCTKSQSVKPYRLFVNIPSDNHNIVKPTAFGAVLRITQLKSNIWKERRRPVNLYTSAVSIYYTGTKNGTGLMCLSENYPEISITELFSKDSLDTVIGEARVSNYSLI